jgi:hypothetical protein
MSPHRGKFVAYFRVSTDKQGKSGLGLEAQRKAVLDYLNGGSWELIEEFVEVESGKHADRPQLAAALAACKKHKARLVIAKLDRLSRNLAFIAALMESGVEFTAVDNPHANKLTVHILAAVAEPTSDRSARTNPSLFSLRKLSSARGLANANHADHEFSCHSCTRPAIAAYIDRMWPRDFSSRSPFGISPLLRSVRHEQPIRHSCLSTRVSPRGTEIARASPSAIRNSTMYVPSSFGP